MNRLRLIARYLFMHVCHFFLNESYICAFALELETYTNTSEILSTQGAGSLKLLISPCDGMRQKVFRARAWTWRYQQNAFGSHNGSIWMDKIQLLDNHFPEYHNLQQKTDASSKFNYLILGASTL